LRSQQADHAVDQRSRSEILARARFLVFRVLLQQALGQELERLFGELGQVVTDHERFDDLDRHRAQTVEEWTRRRRRLGRGRRGEAEDEPNRGETALHHHSPFTPYAF